MHFKAADHVHYFFSCVKLYFDVREGVNFLLDDIERFLTTLMLLLLKYHRISLQSITGRKVEEWNSLEKEQRHGPQMHVAKRQAHIYWPITPRQPHFCEFGLHYLKLLENALARVQKWISWWGHRKNSWGETKKTKPYKTHYVALNYSLFQPEAIENVQLAFNKRMTKIPSSMS